jgi:tRNA A37 threonylcarbamoyladenosine dehydratase
MVHPVTHAASVAAAALVGALVSAWLVTRASGSATAETKRPDSSELREEQFSRSSALFGHAGQAAVEGAYVVVVGCGGVGSHAAASLARSGIGRLRLIDFDNVTLSSLNRAATAVREDVGTPKVAALAHALSRVVPACRLEALPRLFTMADAEELICGGGSPDFVLDCIDDKATKCELLEFCTRAGLSVLSSLGAGGKADPTQVHVADLALVRHDPLGSALRLHLRRAGVIDRWAPQRGQEQKDTAFFSKAGGAAKVLRPMAVAPTAVGVAACSSAGIGTGKDAAVEEERAPMLHEGEVESPLPGFVQVGAMMGTATRGPRDLERERAERERKGKGKRQWCRDEQKARGAAAASPRVGKGDKCEEEDFKAVPLSGITCVYSSERQAASLLPLDDAAPEELGAVPGFRVRVLPVLGALPAVFGQALAAHVLCSLAQLPTHASTDPPLTPNVAARLQGRGLVWEEQHYGRGVAWGGWGGLGIEEVDYAAVSTWRLRSALSGARHGLRSVNLLPVRWRPWAGPGPANILLLTMDEAEALTAAACTPALLTLAEAAASGPVEGRPAARAALEADWTAAMIGCFTAMARPSPLADFAMIEERLAWVKRDGWF